MKVVISQPRYLPVISYVQRLAFADRFILLDNVKRQYAGWENRNKLLLPKPKWLTIPISSSRMEIIKNTLVRDSEWVEKHKRSIIDNYKNHPFFDEDLLDMYYNGVKDLIDGGNRHFADIIEKTIHNLGEIFGFSPKIIRASSIENSRIRNTSGPAKLLEICRAAGAKTYISGENGRVYGVPETFAGSGIAVKFHMAQTFEYPQPGQGEFIPYMGFFDALFCVGRDRLAEEILKEPQLAD